MLGFASRNFLGESWGGPSHFGACLALTGRSLLSSYIYKNKILLASSRTANPNYCSDEWLAFVITAEVAYC